MLRALAVAALVTLCTAFSVEAQNLCNSEYCTKTTTRCSMVGVSCWGPDITYCRHCSCAPTTAKWNCCLRTSSCCAAASDLYEGNNEMCKLVLQPASTPPPQDAVQPQVEPAAATTAADTQPDKDR